MTTRDRTRHTVAVHLAALGAPSFEVGVLMTGRMTTLTGSAVDIVRRVPWLLGRNAQGAHIFVRPVGTEVVLVDDLTHGALVRMHRDQIIPAAVVETSPQNFQAWIRVADAPLPREMATAVARLLCATYGGDPNAAHVRQYGRLAGFTNRKEKYRRGEAFPVVALRAARGGMTPAAEALLERAQAHWRDDQRRQEERLRQGPAAMVRAFALERAVLTADAADDGEISPLGQMYRREAARLLQRYPGADLSKADWMILTTFVWAFEDVTAAELARAMIEGSPRLAERKRGHVHDYIARSVAKALALRATPEGAPGRE